MNNPNMKDLIEDNAIFFLSHSGGKDSQAMYLVLSGIIPAEQLVVVHAHLGKVEHAGVISHIESTIDQPLNVIKANWKDGSEKDLLDMVGRRHDKLQAAGKENAPWFSSSQRYCTSDMKRDPIHKFIRQTMKARGSKLAVNVTGMRAEESSARAKLSEWDTCSRLCTAGRTVYEWRPIHAWTIDMVFTAIERAGQTAHPAYYGDNISEKAPRGGNERLSCVFCMMASSNDLRNGARANPELAREYVQMERDTGYTMFHKKSLESVIGDLIPAVQI
tara:strand:- start:2916 stop:3740 length:825 start_codon:yes stop_codon:yes gene_type:complete